MNLFRYTGSRFTATALATAALVACGGDSSGPGRTAATLTANSPQTGLTAVAGGAVGNPPSVIAKDQNGAPLSGATVTFSVLTGGGLVSTPNVVTDANGVATVGTWTLGQTAGTNTLSASSGSAPALTFTANGTAGPPASLTKVPAGDNQTTRAGFVVDVPPAVVVKDQYGNPVAGAIVNFAAITGGGAVDEPNAVSAANGTATVGGWRLGLTAGQNTLSASAVGLTPVTFTATGTPNPPCSRTSHGMGTTSTGALSTTDCNDSFGSYQDLYDVNVPTGGIYVFNENSSEFDTFLEIFRPDQTIIGYNDDDVLAQITNSRLKVLIPAGDYVLAATSFFENKKGSYTLTSSPSSQPVTNCEDMWVMRGVSTDQSLQGTDCLFNQFYSDDYFIFLKAGESMTVTMNSAFDSVLEIYDGDSGARVVVGDDPGSFNSQAIFTPTASGFYVIAATSKVSQTLGTYTLIIQ